MSTPADTGPEHSLRLVRTIHAPRQRVFDAWVKPELRKRWWRAAPEMFCDVCEVDARPGGRYRVNMKQPGPDAREYVTIGEFIEVVEPAKLVFTWRWESWRDSHEDARVTVELRAVDAETTELTLTHDKLPDANAAREHTEGWRGALDALVGWFS